MFMMIHGTKNSKLGEDRQKFLEKSVPQKRHQKNKALPEKTKFTLQYNTVNNETVKTADAKVVRPLIPQQYVVLRNSRANLTVAQTVKGKTVRERKSNKTYSDNPQFSDYQKISSQPFPSIPTAIGTASKHNIATTRSTKGSVTVKDLTDNQIGPLSKPEWKRGTGYQVQSFTPQLKTYTRKTPGEMVDLKKSMNSLSGMRRKELERSVGKKMTPGSKSRESVVHDAQSAKVNDGENIPERARRRCDEEGGKVIAKERSRSQEIKRIKDKDKSVKLGEITEKSPSEGKNPFSGLEKTASYLALRERNRRDVNALDFQDNKKPFTSGAPAQRNASKVGLTARKENAIIMHGPALDGTEIRESKSRANMGCNVDYNNNQDIIVESYSSRPGEDYSSLESVERIRRDEDLLSLDSRIWSNLEVQIRETCEKTDILCDSGDDSGESVSDMINELCANREDEDIMECLKTLENNMNEQKYPNCREEWNALSMDVHKSKVDLWNRSPDMEKIEMESRTKDSFDRPKSRRAFEETFDRKISQEWKRTKSSESSKMKDSKQEFRTKSLSDEIKCAKFGEESHAKGTKERKPVHFLDEHELGSKWVSSSFFHTHKNVGFIGKDMDEEYVSFEPGQVTLYLPHESQMLLYDIANCAATQGYLKMCGITYNVAIRKNAEQMSPSGRVPFISSSLCIIPEFEAIVSFMQYKKFAYIPVKENDQSAFRATISMIVDVLETAERYICWYDDTTMSNYTRPRIEGQYPFPLNHIMHWKKRHEERSRLSERGYASRSFDLILNEISSCFRTLSRRLGNKSFFFGNIGTEVDALVYGHIYALFTVEVDGPLRDLQFIIQEYPNLVSFACNFDKTFSLDKFPSLELTYWDNILRGGRFPSGASFTVRT